MIEETPVSAYVHECVRILNKHLHHAFPGEGWSGPEESIEAILELVELPWDEGTEKDVDFREGYETALLDIVEAIAQAWHVELPRMQR